jgi:UDPglucose 6-dehydrogenase
MIGIVGKGFVGSAVAAAYRQEDVKFLDPKYEGSVQQLQDLLECEAIFICLPTPANFDGSCDYSLVDAALSALLKFKYNGLVICKSTVPHFVYEEYSLYGMNIVFVPEFLRAATAVDDYLNAEYFIVGANRPDLVPMVQHVCEDLVEHYRPISFRHVTIREACLVKYFENSFLATKVSLMNEFRDLTVTLHANWDVVISALTLDPRICPDHTQVPGPDGKFGWGGHCFPKDTSALLDLAADNDVELLTLKSAVESNKKYRGKNEN